MRKPVAIALAALCGIVLLIGGVFIYAQLRTDAPPKAVASKSDFRSDGVTVVDVCREIDLQGLAQTLREYKVVIGAGITGASDEQEAYAISACSLPVGPPSKNVSIVVTVTSFEDDKAAREAIMVQTASLYDENGKTENPASIGEDGVWDEQSNLLTTRVGSRIVTVGGQPVNKKIAEAVVASIG